MGTPFNTINHQVSDVIPATPPQLSFIRTLLAERDWQSADNPKYVERVQLIADALAYAPDGDAVNAYLRAKVEPPLPKPGASKLIGWLVSQPVRLVSHGREKHLADTGAAMYSDMPTAEEVPAGRYAIETENGAVNTLAFYKVDRPTEGRWAGYVFVKHIVGDDEQRTPFAMAKGVLRRIAEVGAQNAAARYGHEIGECGLCGRTLTNDESRERGIGPICAEKMGW